MECFNKFILICLLSAVFLAGIYHPLFAYVMSSGNYKIQSDDSLTPSGGLGTSANYIFKDTMGEVSTGPSDSSSYAMRAGFQEMQETYLTVSAPADFFMTPDIPGISGGVATGTAPFTVISDNEAGFSMGINASTAHAMLLDGSDPTHYFDNYTIDGVPIYGWNVTSAAKFGFTVSPGLLGGLAPAFSDDGLACGSGSGSGNCYAGFITTLVNIISTTSRTSNTGEQENIMLKAESNNNVLESGTYDATITTTVSSN